MDPPLPREMKTGLLFGTFNPIHRSHLILAQSLAEWKELEELWFVVTPHNPHKEKGSLLNDAERLHMVELATARFPSQHACDIEFSLPQPNYTVDSLEALMSTHPSRRFYLCMGADNLLSFPRWKDPNRILSLVDVLVYPRPGADIPVDFPFANHPKISIMEAPLMDRSATEIRARLGMLDSVDQDLPPEVAAYIEARQHYR